VVKARTVDLLVPAHAEMILEGMLSRQRRELKDLSATTPVIILVAGMYPVFHVTCITQRKDPIYPATIVGKPPMEDCYMGKATERMFLPLSNAAS